MSPDDLTNEASKMTRYSTQHERTVARLSAPDVDPDRKCTEGEQIAQVLKDARK
jgi:hypothetical protein